MRIAKLVLVLALAGPLWAQDVTLGPFPMQDRVFSWQLPTQCTDGSAIGSPGCPALTAINLYCDNGQSYTAGGADTTLTAPAADFPPGAYTCFATAASGAEESAASNNVLFTVTFAVPAAPSGLTVGP